MGIKVVITGPESVGKSTLAKQLAKEYGGIYIEEFARSYIQKLNRPYAYEDVEEVAKYQIDKYDRLEASNQNVFYDTFLEITKVWFEHVYHKLPNWFNRNYAKRPVDLYLLCKPDLPWVDDPVRENGHIREELFEKYKAILNSSGCKFAIVEGQGELRLQNAINKIKEII